MWWPWYEGAVSATMTRNLRFLRCCGWCEDQTGLACVCGVCVRAREIATYCCDEKLRDSNRGAVGHDDLTEGEER